MEGGEVMAKKINPEDTLKAIADKKAKIADKQAKLNEELKKLNQRQKRYEILSNAEEYKKFKDEQRRERTRRLVKKGAIIEKFFGKDFDIEHYFLTKADDIKKWFIHSVNADNFSYDTSVIIKNFIDKATPKDWLNFYEIANKNYEQMKTNILSSVKAENQ